MLCLAAVSCREAVEPESPDPGSEAPGCVVLHASLPATRTYIVKEDDVYKLKWQSTDEIGLSLIGSTSAGPQAKLSVDKIDASGLATFKGDAPAGFKAGAGLNLLCPSIAWNGASDSNGSIPYRIGQVQHPADGSFDPDCDIMYSRVWTGSSEFSAGFTRVVSLIKVNITGETGFSKVQYLQITAPGKSLTGDFMIDDKSAIVASSSTSDCVKAVFESGFAIGDGDNVVFLAVNPFTLGESDSIQIEIGTDTGTVSKTVSPEAAKSFNASTVVPVNLNFGGSGPVPPVAPGDFYISPGGKDTNDGLTQQTPFKTFAAALKHISPGKTLCVMPGEYKATAWNDLITMDKSMSGRPGEYVTIKALDPANKPVLFATGTGVWNAININASYVIIDGLEVKGDNAAISYDEAYDCARRHFYKDNQPDWGVTALYNTNGISIGGTGQKSSRPDHVIIRNCVVHDLPGCGISAIQADWITIDHNVVYNNAWFTMYGCSGISFLTPVNNDDDTSSYKMVITNNICYCNMTKVPWTGTSNFTLSDGNGIIIDVNNKPDGSGVAKSEGAYRGRTLVANNVSFYNGGSGIHTFKADHVDITNNTAYYNARQFPANNYAEIWTNQSSYVNITNNIMYARPDGYCNLGVSNGTQVFANNVYCGATKVIGNGDIKADPMFVNLSTSMDAADFHLKPGSPAIGHGVRTPYTPSTDIEGTPRGSSLDAGAYQTQSQ